MSSSEEDNEKVPSVDDTNDAMEEENVIKRLENYNIQSDPTEEEKSGTDNVSGDEMSQEELKNTDKDENGRDPTVEKTSNTSESGTTTSEGTASDTALVPDIKPQPVKTKKNPFAVLKQRLSLDGSKDKEDKEKKEQQKNKAKLDKILQNVKVDTLPQTFVTKYLGSKPSKGLYGLKYTREPVEALVQDISSNKKGTVLPLLNVQVSTKGLYMTPHKSNKSEQLPVDVGLLPIEFVSYGVQDIKYTRIFSYIVVREMSSKSKTLECHSMLCDSMVTARKLALSVSFAFKEYAKTLQGKPYKFKVDLQQSEEVEDVNQDVEEDEACEA